MATNLCDAYVFTSTDCPGAILPCSARSLPSAQKSSTSSEPVFLKTTLRPFEPRAFDLALSISSRGRFQTQRFAAHFSPSIIGHEPCNE